MSVFTDNIGIKRIIAHSIPSGHGNARDIFLSSRCFERNEQINVELKDRIIQLLNSKSLEFVFNPLNNSTFIDIRSAISADDDQAFVDVSKEIAKKLNAASTNPRIPECLMIVIQATTSVGSNRQDALFLLRAEPQTGFKKSVNTSAVNLEFVNELFLSKSQKMLKIAAVVTPEQTDTDLICDRAESRFRCLVYDENYEIGKISSSAKYFTFDFLGCSIPEDAKKKTYDFYSKTMEFINQSDMTDGEKIRAKDGLNNMLVSESSTIVFDDFAREFFPQRIRMDYMDKLSTFYEGLSTISKDLSLINKDIKRNCIEFLNGVSLRFTDNDASSKFTIVDENEECTTIRISSRIKKLK